MWYFEMGSVKLLNAFYNMSALKWLFQSIGAVQYHLLTNLMYGVGIGIPAVIAKLLGKHFLTPISQKTTWIKHKASIVDDVMY